ncbi:MAG: carboxypeptidase-like regulatory domain-containing protein, partial [Bacteroidota bacterium]
MRAGLLLAFVFCNIILFAQQFVRGTISDERNVAIPFAKVFVKNNTDQRTVSDEDGKYELSVMPGEYFLVFSAIGFQDREAYVSINNKDIVRDIQLFPIKIQELQGVEVTVKKSNPGREIMLEVVKKREQINPWNYPHTVDVYIKASEKLDIEEKEKKNSDPERTDADPLESADKKDKKLDWTDK